MARLFGCFSSEINPAPPSLKSCIHPCLFIFILYILNIYPVKDFGMLTFYKYCHNVHLHDVEIVVFKFTKVTFESELVKQCIITGCAKKTWFTLQTCILVTNQSHTCMVTPDLPECRFKLKCVLFWK